MWKERLHRLLGRLHLDGRDISVFLMSLLLAFSIWLIHNLSLNYSDTISVPVVAQCNIDGHSDVSSNSSMIAARCRTSGFSLLRIRHQAKRKALTIRFDGKDLHHKEGELFTSPPLSSAIMSRRYSVTGFVWSLSFPRQFSSGFRSRTTRGCLSRLSRC